MRTAITLIRLGGLPSLYEPSFDIHVDCVLSRLLCCAAAICMYLRFFSYSLIEKKLFVHEKTSRHSALTFCLIDVVKLIRCFYIV